MFWPLEVSLTTAREKIKKGGESNGSNNNNKKAVINASCGSIASCCLLEWGGEKQALPESRQTCEVAAAWTSGSMQRK